MFSPEGSTQHSTATVPRPGLWSFWSYECKIIYIVKYLIIWFEKCSKEMLTRQGKTSNQHLQNISHRCRYAYCWTQFLLLEFLFDSDESSRARGLWDNFYIFLDCNRIKCHLRLITNVMAIFRWLNKSGLNLLENDL